MIIATFYQRPDGRKSALPITSIRPEDELWFEQHRVSLSLEELGPNNFAFYADLGMINAEGEVEEVMEISLSRDCAETLTALRHRCERALMGEE